MFYYFDQIKKEIPILDVISYYEGKQYPDNTEFVCCPSATHPDKHPSAKINRNGFAENTCHCFSCSRTFNVLTVVKEATGAEDDVAAAARLFSDLHIDPTPYTKGKAEIQNTYLSPEEGKAIGLPNFDRNLTEPTKIEMDGKIELIPPEKFSEFDILQMILIHASETAVRLNDMLVTKGTDIVEELMELDEFGPNVYQIYKEYIQKYNNYESLIKEAYNEELRNERDIYRSKEDAMRLVKGDSYKSEPFSPKRDFKTFCSEMEKARPDIKRPQDMVFYDHDKNPLRYIPDEEAHRLALDFANEVPIANFDAYTQFLLDIEESNQSFRRLLIICSGIQVLEDLIAAAEKNRRLCIKVLGKYANKYEQLYQAEVKTQEQLIKDGIEYDVPEHIIYPDGFAPSGKTLSPKPTRALIPKTTTSAKPTITKRPLVKKTLSVKEGEHNEH